MSKPKPEIIKTTIRVPKSVWQAVQHLAIDEDVTAEWIVITALAEYLKTKGGK
jgi:predicted transcriptional regulator